MRLTQKIYVLPSVLVLGLDLAEPGSREHVIVDRSMFKIHYSKLHELHSMFEQNFLQYLKAASAAADWPLTISEEAKVKVIAPERYCPATK